MSFTVSSCSSSSLALRDSSGKRRSWAIYQKRKGKPLQVWAYSLSKDSYLEEEGETATSLLERIDLENGEKHQIDPQVLCFPTGFDLQVHLRFPGQSHKETVLGGQAAGFFGGYDSVLTMPNTAPFLDNPPLLRSSIEEMERAFPPGQADTLKVYFSVSATKNMAGKEVVELGALKEAGASAVTDDGWGVDSDTLMDTLFSLCEEYDIPFLQHAEIPGHGGHASPGSLQSKYKIPPYPRTAESQMVQRDVLLLEKHKKARYHVLHISTMETLEVIRRAKEKGLPITCEVTPHHLFFSNEDIPSMEGSMGTNFKMNPPLFSLKDREALQKALEEGIIDAVSTDHAPHSLEEKETDWVKAPFGTRGLLTALPCLITLMKKGIVSEERIREAYAYSGRRILYGASAPKPSGYVFVDPDKNFTLQKEDLTGISRNSCFLGTKLFGKIIFRAEKAHIFSNR